MAIRIALPSLLAAALLLPVVRPASAQASDPACDFISSPSVKIEGPRSLSYSACLTPSKVATFEGAYVNISSNAPDLYLNVMINAQSPVSIKILYGYLIPTVINRSSVTSASFDKLGPLSFADAYVVRVRNIAPPNNSISVGISLVTQTSNAIPEFPLQTSAVVALTVAIVAGYFLASQRQIKRIEHPAQTLDF